MISLMAGRPRHGTVLAITDTPPGASTTGTASAAAAGAGAQQRPARDGLPAPSNTKEPPMRRYCT